MNILEFVLYVDMKCRAHKLLIAIMADPKQRDDYISKIASSANMPVEKVEEGLDRLAKTCWIVSGNTTEGMKEMESPRDSERIFGNMHPPNRPLSSAGDYKSGRQDSGFDIIKFVAGKMECYHRLLKDNYNS
jgi:hypothetical protein